MNSVVDVDRVQELIEAVDRADSADALLEAVEDLAAVASEAAIPTLIAVLGYNNPGAAVAAVDGLIALGEAAVPSLLQQIDDYNYGARAWAIRALAGIGDTRALELLLTAANNDFSLSVRRAAARGLGNLRWYQLSSDEISNAQARVLQALLLAAARDGEWVVRYAAVMALQHLAATAETSQPETLACLLEQLQQSAYNDSVLAVRARAQLALERIETSEISLKAHE